MPFTLDRKLSAQPKEFMDFSRNGGRAKIVGEYLAENQARMDYLALKLHDYNAPENNAPSDAEIKASEEYQAEYDVRKAEHERVTRKLDDVLIWRPNDLSAECDKRAYYAMVGGVDLVKSMENSGSLMTAEELVGNGCHPPHIFAGGAGVTAIVFGFPSRNMLGQAPGLNVDAMQAALDKTTGSLGNALPESVAQTAWDRLKKYGGYADWFHTLMTQDGNKMGFPNFDDVSRTGAWMAEGYSDAGTAADPILANQTLDAYVLTSRPMGVTKTALRDTTYDLAGVIERLLFSRMGRSLFDAITQGDGSGKPSGIIGGAKTYVLPDGQTKSLATNITMDVVFDLIDQVDDGYIDMGMGMHEMSPQAGRVGFMLSKSARTALRKLKDSDGRLLWQPELPTGMPSTIAGFPWVTNNQLPSIAASAKGPMLFGSFGYYCLRMVEAMMLLVYDDSTWARLNQRGFQAFLECDGKLVGGFVGNSTATSEAISVLQMAAT